MHIITVSFPCLDRKTQGEIDKIRNKYKDQLNMLYPHAVIALSPCWLGLSACGLAWSTCGLASSACRLASSVCRCGQSARRWSQLKLWWKMKLVIIYFSQLFPYCPKGEKYHQNHSKLLGLFCFEILCWFTIPSPEYETVKFPQIFWSWECGNFFVKYKYIYSLSFLSLVLVPSSVFLDHQHI